MSISDEKPWVAHYDPGVMPNLEYPDLTLYEAMKRTGEQFPDAAAIAFKGLHISYGQMKEIVDLLACVLEDEGIGKKDVMTICLPNIPHAMFFFYAVNRLGSIANLVHPKMPKEELRSVLISTGSRYLVILDAFFPKHQTVLEEGLLEKVYVASVGDYLSFFMNIAFYLTRGRKIPRLPCDSRLCTWREIKEKMKGKEPCRYERKRLPTEAAVYLHSGGTTGSPKTIMLSSANLNMLAAQGPQIVNIPNPHVTKKEPKKSMLTILPLFHGFGLTMGMHTMVFNALTSVLVPEFSAAALAAGIRKEKVSFIAAVPTLYEGMLKNKKLKNADLSFLSCCFCGGDSLSADLKKRFEAFLHDRGANISLREGYGLTETVTVCAVNPEYKSKFGSIGLPLADILMKIVEPGTEKVLPAGENGEICVCGPSVMLGYLGDPEGTKEALKMHSDGRVWVHTGDFGYMDENGYFFFVQRLKRIIKVSGVPVFPSQIEDLISSVEKVEAACVIAFPDDHRIHVAKALVIPDSSLTPEERNLLKNEIHRVCVERLISYARPVEIEFYDQFPMTIVGKIDYVELEKQDRLASENKTNL